jgi:nucleoid-associated protein YgaU
MNVVRNRGRWWTLTVACAAMLVTGCAKDKALQQVEALNRALGQAKDACASVYAADTLAVVQGNVDEANQLKDRGKYRKALNKADATMPDVGDLRSKAAEARDKAKADAEQAIQEAETAMAEADKAEAAKYAKSYYDPAQAKLAEARKLAQDPCKFREAAAAAREVPDLARRASNAAVAEKQRLEEEARRAEEARRRAEEEARLRAEEEARRNAKPPNYVVQKGDYLWKISGMDKIYAAHKFWPLIFDANRGKIQDPDLIYPNQDLTIPRQLSGDEMMSKLRLMWSKAARGEAL